MEQKPTLSPFEQFVNRLAAVPKEAVQALEVAREKRVRRTRRKPKQPTK